MKKPTFGALVRYTWALVRYTWGARETYFRRTKKKLGRSCMGYLVVGLKSPAPNNMIPKNMLW